MSHARVEEVSDSDPEEMDIEELAPTHRTNQTLIDPANIPFQTTMDPAGVAFQTPDGGTQMRAPDRMTEEKTKNWQCVYPVYFDSTRSRAEGRRVSKEQGVANPLARDIVDAVQGLRLNAVFEPGKTHPKDWANPGRVKILLKEDGVQIARNVKNKHHLYTLIAKYLKANPTTVNSPLRLKIPGMPPTAAPPPPPAIPRGWKMGTILPLHSAAVSGGGVSENLFKDMMQEMQGLQGDAGAESATLKPKKDKKKIKS